MKEDEIQATSSDASSKSNSPPPIQTPIQISIQIPIQVSIEKPIPIKINLERQSTHGKSAFFIGCYLLFEMSKQLGTFSLATSNHNTYPLPASLLIVMTEMVKLGVISVYLQFGRCRQESRLLQGFSFKFAWPAVFYFVTNLAYLYALTLTSPPVWMILIQTRVLYTAMIYKIVLSKDVSRLQMLGCFLIVVSILLTRLSEIQSGHLTITMPLLAISQVSSLLSSIASLVVELLLKNDSRSFAEQQFWLYLSGMGMGILALIADRHRGDFNIVKLIMDPAPGSWDVPLICFSVVASSLVGLCVPVILRNLDSIVKDYLAALNNILLGLLTCLLFPHYFSINSMFWISLLLLLFGITLYERKTKESLVKFFYCV